MTVLATESSVLFTSDGSSTHAHLHYEEKEVSWLWIIPFTLRIGAAKVRMDGIGGVGTDEHHRNRGFSRRVLEASVDWMKGQDAALSMLYGIPNYYPKFGYATAGPDHFIMLPPLPVDAPLPDGWAARPIEESDLPELERIYRENTMDSVGSAIRSMKSAAWNSLLKNDLPSKNGEAGCRIVVDPQGKIAAYVWRGSKFWYANQLKEQWKKTLILSEVMADSPAAADAALVVCRKWASEESATDTGPAEEVILTTPPKTRIAAAAMHHSARFQQSYSACGESMARTLDVVRLLNALKPELDRRLKCARYDKDSALAICTDIGNAMLAVTPQGVSVSESSTDRNALVIEIPQYELARLALGAFPPRDLMMRQRTPPAEDALRLIDILFPLRHPHMYLPDRF